MIKNRIGVIGSINTDIVCETDKLPKIGETVMGNKFLISFGGKGANEAVACARLGASTNLLGCVGDDMFSKNAIANLQQEGVHITAVKQLKGKQGGIANITVHNGNNQIVVISGANALVDENYINKYANRIKECSIVGCQFETPIEALVLASDICVKNGIKFVLNPSPIKKYPKKLFNNASYVIVNEVEIQEVEGYNPQKPFEILEKHANKLILTKGKSGVYYHNGQKLVNVPAINVKVLDTTGAGDTFLGSFMVAINNNFSLFDAVTFANICAGLKTTKLGAQTAMPTLNEVKKYVKKNKINLQINF